MCALSLSEFLERNRFDPVSGVHRILPNNCEGSLRVWMTTTWTPTSVLAKAVYAAGFLYDPWQDIIYSRMDPLQRQFGFAYGYDVATLAINGIVDCEPIFFDYAGRHWMIELWKGQYGLETGCEIGVYTRPIGSTSEKYVFLDAIVGRRHGDPKPSHNLFYECANNDELLEMSFTLYKNGQKLFSRGPEKHWWVTGFKWGVYSRADELMMDISINCQDTVMCAALVDALQGMRYNVNVSSTTVRFRFQTPTTHQPRLDTPAIVQTGEYTNQAFVNAYNAFGFPNNDPNTIPDTAVTTIMEAVAIYSPNFFAQAVVNLAKIAGRDPSSVISGIVEVFGIGIDVAADLVSQAGYEFSGWVGAAQSSLGINLDYSCIVEISARNSPYDLILEGYGVKEVLGAKKGGYYAVRPPYKVKAGGITRFWLKDRKPSPFGADGWAEYSYVDSANNRHFVKFTYACPTATSNVAATSAPFNFYAKSDSVHSGWNAINRIKERGHPLFVAFVYGNAPAPS